MTSSVSTIPPEVNAGTTTSWLPISTAWPSASGCESSFYKINPTILAAWYPGYGYIQQNLSCQPPQVTTWWGESQMSIDLSATQYSLGPVVCPEAYSTATTSVNSGGSTFIGCCPSGYTFAGFQGAGILAECDSALSSGEVVEFATYASSSWIISTSTVQSDSAAYGVQVNGWIFPGSTTSQTAPTTSHTPSTTSSSSAVRSISVKVGVGVGIPLGVIAIVSLALAFIFYRRAKAALASAKNPGSEMMARYATHPEFPDSQNAPVELHGITATQASPMELPTPQLPKGAEELGPP